jgi:hypothetical protein
VTIQNDVIAHGRERLIVANPCSDGPNDRSESTFGWTRNQAGDQEPTSSTRTVNARCDQRSQLAVRPTNLQIKPQPTLGPINQLPPQPASSVRIPSSSCSALKRPSQHPFQGQHQHQPLSAPDVPLRCRAGQDT